ncbi:MAG: PAS-domain containing protein, partial [Gammaproteobacteria bacterium]|nr:PAS-domain containing protein [Gammaproteobacteria bacterium]
MNSKTPRKQLLKDFMAWQRDEAASVSIGLEFLREFLGAAALTIFRAQKGTHFPIYFTVTPNNRISAECVSHLLSEHLNLDGNFNTQTMFEGAEYYVLGYVFQTKKQNEPIAVSVWTETELDLNEADQIFLDMAIEACRLRVSTKYIEEFRLPQALSEAFDAVDDGFIIYDKDLQIVALNKRQRELFPSVSGTLNLGANYEAILRKQLSSRQLPIPEDEGEAWIKSRKSQIRQHGYTEEQKFDSGETIRLTNYKTESGGAVAVRSDITELVEARQKAVENEQLFRALLIGAPIPLIIITGVEIVSVSY